MAILTELRDPRVQNVTVVGVEVAPDMRSAKVAVSIMGAENKQQLTLNALQRAAGFLQSRIADRIDTRYTPKLTFVMDRGVKHSLEVLRILNEVLPAESNTAAGDELEQRSSPQYLGPENQESDANREDPDDFDEAAGGEPGKPR
jgi:ribosome-binding factor A